MKELRKQGKLEDLDVSEEIKDITLSEEKYFRDEVENAHIYMVNPKNFNDPFDSSSVLKIEDIGRSERLKKIFMDWVRTFSDRREVRNIFNHRNWFERLKKLTTNFLKYEKKLKNSLNLQNMMV